jgi:hypothetical protein
MCRMREGRDNPVSVQYLQTCQRAGKANGVQSPVQVHHAARCLREEGHGDGLAGLFGNISLLQRLGSRLTVVVDVVEETMVKMKKMRCLYVKGACAGRIEGLN